MSEHEEAADRLEHEVDDLAERNEKLGDHIDQTRDQWEAHKADDNVPGAVGEALGDASEETGDPPPEARKPG